MARKHLKSKSSNLKSASRFSKTQLLIVVLIFGTIGGYYLLQSFAAEPLPDTTSGSSPSNSERRITIFDITQETSKLGSHDAGADVWGPAGRPDGTVNMYDVTYITNHFGT
jgi:hypothetical protein